MAMYINHIIWRFVKHKPDQYRLLDVRHDVMKNLILGDCDDLIKFILFGNKEGNDSTKDTEEGKENEVFKIKHIPRTKFWIKKHKYTKDDDLVCGDDGKKKKLPDHKKPKNAMELAIFHCKSNFNLLITLFATYLPIY